MTDTAKLELPFEIAEYRDRARRVRERMADRGIDVLFVTSPPNLLYLTGFHSIWYPPRAPLGAVLRADDDQLLFVDYERHEHLARALAHFDEARFFRYDDAVDTVAELLKAQAGASGVVGVERWTVTPGAPVMDELIGRLRDAGVSVGDGDWIVDRVRLVKSPAELVYVERASSIVDAAYASLPDFVRPGRTELEIAAHLDQVMSELGGERAAIETMVSAGPQVWARTHSAPATRPVQEGDVMYVDCCGVVERYHVDVCRTFAIVEDNPGAREILDYTSGSVLEVQRGVRTGDPLDVAQKIAEDYVFSRYSRDQVWWVGGYALGLGLRPNWVGHTYLSNDAWESFTWEPGYLTNYENIVFSREGGFTASYMESLLMTETGIRVLSKLPRTLTVLPG